MSTIVYKYGIHAPDENAEAVLDLLDRAWEFRRDLTIARNARRAAERAITDDREEVKALIDATTRAKEEYLTALVAVRKDRVEGQSRKLTPETRAIVDPLRAAFKSAREALWEARRKVLLSDGPQKKSPAPEGETRGQRQQRSMQERAARLAEAERTGRVSIRVLRDQIAEQYNAAVRAAYAKHTRVDGPRGSILGSDTAQLVKAVIEQSDRTRKPYASDAVTPLLLRHPARWEGARMAVILRDEEMPLRDVLAGKSTQLQFVLPPETAWLAPSRGERRRARKLGRLRLAIGKDAQGQTVWAGFPLDMHRPMPDDARILRAVIRRCGIGPHHRWELTVTVETERRVMECEGRAAVVAVALECREDGDDLRVAHWVGSDGASGIERLSGDPEPSVRTSTGPYGVRPRRPGVLAALDLPHAIRAARDLRFNAARDKLVAMAAQWRTVPEGAAESLRTVAQWRSPARLVSFWRRMGEHLSEQPEAERDPAMVATYDMLTSWAARDRHEWACEARESERARLRRREQYRVFGARLAERYEKIVFADEMLVQRRPDVADEEYDRGEKRRSLGVLAALGELRDAVGLVAPSRGCERLFYPIERGSAAGAKALLDAYLAAPEKATTKLTSRKEQKAKKIAEKEVDGQPEKAAKKGGERARRRTARKVVCKAAE